MSSAVAFQTNGLGSLFQCSAQTVMAWVRLSTEVNTPRRRRLSVNSLNHRSTRLSQELEVGMKCRCQRRRLLCANHCRTSGALCADRLSRMTCTDRPFCDGGVDLFEERQHVRAGVSLPQVGV